MSSILFVIWNVIQGLILISLGVVMIQVVKLQGRLLIRLDGLERRQSFPGAVDHMGLAVGTPITAFRLPDLAGRLVSSDDLQGRWTLLVHWSFGCGFCDLIASDLARHRDDLAEKVRLVLASRDDAATSRTRAAEYGLGETIVLLDEGSPLATEAFRHQGTPVAYLLDERGRVARPLAVGGEAILDLAQAAVADRGGGRVRLPNERPLSQSRIKRNGLRAGTLAPAFRLPEVRGGTVALDDFRGRRVLLVFTDPQCGPCDELAPHLVRLHREHGDELTLVLVARGDLEAARRKADRQGLTFPVVVQERWNLSRDYGIFVVPVAFLIGDDGVIVADVARGGDEILALAARDLAVSHVGP